MYPIKIEVTINDLADMEHMLELLGRRSSAVATALTAAELAAPTEPTPEPAPEPAPTHAPAVPSAEELKNGFISYLAAKGLDAGVALLGEFGVKRFAELRSDQFSAFASRLTGAAS